MLFFLLQSAFIRVAKQRRNVWQAAVGSLLLCLMVGCDVRPFSEWLGNESATEESDGEGSDVEVPDIPDAPDPTEPLQLISSSETIETQEGTPQTIQISVENPEPGRTYTFDTIQPLNGEADLDPETGSLTFTPHEGFIGTDSLEVTVTDDGEPARSGTLTIDIIVE